MSKYVAPDLINSRSVLLLYLLVLARAVGMLITDLHAQGEYVGLHQFVAWIPLSPDISWSMICIGLAVGGIWSWWNRHRQAVVGTLLSSGAILTATGGTVLAASTWVPSLVWFVVGIWALLEIDLCARRLI